MVIIDRLLACCAAMRQKFEWPGDPAPQPTRLAQPPGTCSTADCQVIAPSPNVCISIIQMLQRLTNKTPSKSISARMMIGRTSA
jgi:hypothetical protein